MKIVLTDLVIQALKDAPLPVQRAFDKQLRFLATNLQHPSLHANKYDEANDRSAPTTFTIPLCSCSKVAC